MNSYYITTKISQVLRACMTTPTSARRCIMTDPGRCIMTDPGICVCRQALAWQMLCGSCSDPPELSLPRASFSGKALSTFLAQALLSRGEIPRPVDTKQNLTREGRRETLSREISRCTSSAWRRATWSAQTSLGELKRGVEKGGAGNLCRENAASAMYSLEWDWRTTAPRKIRAPLLSTRIWSSPDGPVPVVIGACCWESPLPKPPAPESKVFGWCSVGLTWLVQVLFVLAHK